MQLMHECRDSRDDHYTADDGKEHLHMKTRKALQLPLMIWGEHENISKTTKNTVTAVELLTVLHT